MGKKKGGNQKKKFSKEGWKRRRTHRGRREKLEGA